MNTVGVRDAVTSEDLATARELVEEYVASLGFELDFQDYHRELDSFPGDYAPPDGCLLLAELDGVSVGCVAMRRFAEEVCEMKRLYVRAGCRGAGVGRTLVESVIARAAETGYRTMRLDTIASMTAANALYASLGFVEIPPYRHNPIPGARYFELDLSGRTEPE